MANKKNKKKAQQPAPANKAAANSKVEAKKAVAKKNEKAAKSKNCLLYTSPSPRD